MIISEAVHEHPKATVAFVIVGVIVLWLLFHGGSSGAVSSDGSSATDVGAATEAYVAQQQASAQIHASDNQLTAVTTQLGAAVQGLTIQAQTTNNANNLQSGIALAQINATQESTDLANTLSARVAESNINAGVETTRINTSAATANTTIIASALTQQNQNLANVELANINAQSSRDLQNSLLTYVALTR